MDNIVMTNWKRFLPWPVAALVLIGSALDVMRAQEPKPDPPKPPTIEELTKVLKMVADKDQQIAALQQQVSTLNGNLGALNKLYGSCYQQLSADESQLAKGK